MNRILLYGAVLLVAGLLLSFPSLPAQGVGPGAGGGSEEQPSGDKEEKFLPTLNYDAPEVKKIEERIRERFDASLKRFLTDEKIGLNNKGYVEIRAEVVDKLELKEKSEIKRAVEAENKDRDELVKTVAKVNNLAQEQVPLLQKSYIKAYREKAMNGWWVQGDDTTLDDGTVQKGKWAKKAPPKDETTPSGEGVGPGK
ncbi:MAG: DUF1318 domain-containing protein [Planctomycetota bacterium]|nr:DUF1318 domain-containing protein [Planctomycetota bacterium]